MWRRENCFLAMFLSYCREHKSVWSSNLQYRDILFDILACHEKSFQKDNADDDTSSVELICETRALATPQKKKTASKYPNETSSKSPERPPTAHDISIPLPSDITMGMENVLSKNIVEVRSESPKDSMEIESVSSKGGMTMETVSPRTVTESVSPIRLKVVPGAAVPEVTVKTKSNLPPSRHEKSKRPHIPKSSQMSYEVQVKIFGDHIDQIVADVLKEPYKSNQEALKSVPLSLSNTRSDVQPPQTTLTTTVSSTMGTTLSNSSRRDSQPYNTNELFVAEEVNAQVWGDSIMPRISATFTPSLPYFSGHSNAYLEYSQSSFQAGLQVPVCESTPDFLDREDDDMLLVTADMFSPNFKQNPPALKKQGGEISLPSTTTHDSSSNLDVEDDKRQISDSSMVLFSPSRVAAIREKYKKRQSPPSRMPCKVCGQLFKSYGAKLNHENAHSEGGSFPCIKCHNIFKSEDDLKRHQKFHPNTAKVKNKRERERFCCRLCLKPFFAIGDKMRHDRKRERNQSSLTCSTCDRGFCHKSELITHLRESRHG